MISSIDSISTNTSTSGIKSVTIFTIVQILEMTLLLFKKFYMIDFGGYLT